MDKKKRILYIVAGETGFINTDEKIIRSFADVRTTIIATIWDCFKLELLLNLWFADSILIWFASMHAIPAVLLNYLFNNATTLDELNFFISNSQYHIFDCAMVICPCDEYNGQCLFNCDE